MGGANPFEQLTLQLIIEMGCETGCSQGESLALPCNGDFNTTTTMTTLSHLRTPPPLLNKGKYCFRHVTN